MEVTGKNRSLYLKAINHMIKCDLTIGNVIVFDVFTGKLFVGSVDILEGVIIQVREGAAEDAGYAKAYYNGKGMYLVPGFIDTHIHIESTMMTPENFAYTVLPHGTTTVVADPHETAKVNGIQGVRFMLDNAKKAQLRQFFLAPSCVPAVPNLENSGAVFKEKEISELLDTPGIIGIGEVMDYMNVCKDEDRMHGILQEGLKRGVFIQGHAPRLTGESLNAYITAGAQSDHECRDREECALKQRKGMHVNLKSSSLSNYLKENLTVVNTQRWKDNVSLCTDDVHAEVLFKEGHIDRIIREAISYGADPIELYRFATYNAAREYQLCDLGAVAPGYTADLQLLKNLNGSCPEAVFIGGNVVAEHGKYCFKNHNPEKLHFENSIHLDYDISLEDFKIKVPAHCTDETEALVIQSKYKGTSFNKGFYEKVPVNSGYVDISSLDNYQFCGVFNRYGRHNHTIGIMKGFGIKEGALVSTIAHDSHNITMVYRDPYDAMLAVHALKKSGGGIAVASKGKILSLLPLPVMGLMSDLPASQLADQIKDTEAALKKISDDSCYLLKIATIALPVLPGTIITDEGIVDGEKQVFLSLFKEN